MIAASFLRPLIRWMLVAGLMWSGASLSGQSPQASFAPPVSLGERSVAGETIASWPADPWMTAAQERRIFAVLQEPTSFTFIETPLQDAVRHLDESTGVTFKIDERALEEVGLTLDEPVSLDLQQVPMGVVLRRMLRDLDLNIQIAGGIVTITTPEAAETSLAIRVYDVTPLVAEPVAISGSRYRNRDSLLGLIQESVVPDTWEYLGGPSKIVPRRLGSRAVLVISTTSEVHFEIIALLNRLNEVGYAGADANTIRRATALPKRPSREQTRERISSSNSGLPRFGQ